MSFMKNVTPSSDPSLQRYDWPVEPLVEKEVPVSTIFHGPAMPVIEAKSRGKSCFYFKEEQEVSNIYEAIKNNGLPSPVKVAKRQCRKFKKK